MRKIKIGIIGCGGISWGHALRLRRNPHVEIAGFCDVVLDKAKALYSEIYGYTSRSKNMLYSDYKQMIDEAGLDAVCIFTPHTLHYPQIMYALKRGLHVLSEKPLCCTVKEAKDIVEVSKRKDLVVLVSYQRRFIENFIKAKDLVREKLGRLKFVTICLDQNWKSIAKGTWRASKKLGYGGMFFDSGSHVVDILLWITGKKPEKVYAQVDCGDFEVDLYALVTVELEDGVLASLNICGNSPPGMYEIETFYGETGSAVRIENGKTMFIDENGNRIVFNTRSWLIEGSSPDDNFVNCVLGLEENKSPAEDFLQVIALTEAAYKSSKEQRPVDIKEIYW